MLFLFTEYSLQMKVCFQLQYVREGKTELFWMKCVLDQSLLLNSHAGLWCLMVFRGNTEDSKEYSLKGRETWDSKAFYEKKKEKEEEGTPPAWIRAKEGSKGHANSSSPVRVALSLSTLSDIKDILDHKLQTHSVLFVRLHETFGYVPSVFGIYIQTLTV